MGGSTVLRRHAHEAIRGMLYMIDSEPYPGTSKKLQFEVIREHLRSHAYYCSSKSDPSDRRPRDEKMCRALMQSFVSNNKLSKNKEPGEDGFSMLWRRGLKGIPPKVLAKYGYDPETFDVTMLPGPRSDILDHTQDPASADGNDYDNPFSTSASDFSDSDYEEIGVKEEVDGLEATLDEHEGRAQSRAAQHRKSRAHSEAEMAQDAEGFLSEHQTAKSELSVQLQPRQTEFSLRDTPARRNQPIRGRLQARKSDGKRSKESSVAATTSRSISSKPRTVQQPKRVIIKLRDTIASKWQGEMNALNDSITDVVDKLFDSINLATSQGSPYANDTNKILCSIFKLSFGEDWHSACTHLRDSGSFQATHVLRSLTAASVHARILSDGLDWQRQLCKEIGLHKNEEFQKVFLMLCDPSQNEEARQKYVPRIFAQSILSTEENIPSALDSLSDKHAEEIFGILEPYINTLAGIAELMNQNHLHVAEDFRAEFKVGLKAVVLCAARLKLHLVEAEQEHSFGWPRYGEDFNADIHETAGHDGEMVAFATLPSLRLIGKEPASVLPAHVICCSQVETANPEM